MLWTTFSDITLGLMALAIALHLIRIKGSRPQHSGLASVSAFAWILTSLSVIGAMIDQAIHHPEAMDPAALLCGAGSAAMALWFGLDAVASAVLSSARRTDPPSAPPAIAT